MQQDLLAYLRGNAYPGRGIAAGRGTGGRYDMAVYFIMGRSVNSRNRVFEPTEDGIRTAPYDPAKLQDPSLVIYHPVRRYNGLLIVTNGDQTDTIRDALAANGSFRSALDTRTFEPDAPNYTPRISALIDPDGSFQMAILKSDGGSPDRCVREYYDYAPQPGEGRFLSTYAHDGAPLPSFAGAPMEVALPKLPGPWFTAVWQSLDAENRVALFGWSRDRETGEESCTIINGKDI